MRFQELIFIYGSRKIGEFKLLRMRLCVQRISMTSTVALTEEPMRGSFLEGAFEIKREKLTAGVSADESGKC